MPAIEELTLEINQSIEINADIGDAWTALLRRLSVDNSTPDNRPMPMVLEEWPGGRWFRDMGNGQGHFWAHVQVIKPPTLLEMHGPMFMSYAVAGHMQFRLTQQSGGVELSLCHRVLGFVEEEHRQGVIPGWAHALEQTKNLAEQGRP